MTYINFNNINDSNIELVKKKFNVYSLSGYTISPKGTANELFEEIEKIASSSPRGVFIDVTGLDPVTMSYLNPVCALLNSMNYVPFVVSMNSTGKLVDLTYYYDFNEFNNISDTVEYIELLKKVESFSNL